MLISSWASYEKLRGTAEGERKSKLYNESAFLLSVRAMSATLRNPPPPFQHVIQYGPPPIAKPTSQLMLG